MEDKTTVVEGGEQEQKVSGASVSELKRFLAAKKIDCTNCVEKSELVDAVNAALEKLALKPADFFAWLKSEASVDTLEKELGEMKLEKGLTELSLEGLARALKSGTFKNIIVMTGAGLSVAAGIPDFRSPGTGLYDNLQKYNLPFPEAVFDIQFFAKNPRPFYTLAKELYPGNFDPTLCHHFIGFLAKKGVLLRNFTQNIDTLERVADIPDEFIVEAHGSFSTAHCVTCKAEYTQGWVKDAVFRGDIPKCTAKDCTGLVKPDIVFFGESLPRRFFDCAGKDFPKCDLLIVMGTSLVVHPFAGLVRQVGSSVPRVLINRESVGGFNFNLPMKDGGRDIKCLGDCQETILKLAELAGWKEEFDAYVAEFKRAHPSVNAVAKQPETEENEQGKKEEEGGEGSGKL